MRFNKLTYNGPAKSLSVMGTLFRQGVPVYLLDSELRFSLGQARSFGVVTEIVDSDQRPGSEAAAAMNVGVMWTGNSPVKLTDWGTFHKNVARRDLPPGAAETLLKKGGFVRA